MRNKIFIGVCLSPLIAAAQSTSTLEPVVVSATRSEQNAFDTPASVSVIDAETIRNAGAQVNLSESINRVPGITALNRQNYAQDLQLSIRGFGARSTFGIRGVRVLVDGIPATMPDGQGQVSNISLSSAGRIEVLRGPLAQLYGNAAGGVVQVFTAMPKGEQFGLTTSIGANESYRADVQYGNVVGDKSFLLNFAQFRTEGVRDHSEAKRANGNIKWQWDISSQTKLGVIANAMDQPFSQDPGGLTHAQFDADPKQTAAPFITQDARKVVRQNQIGTVLEHSFDNAGKLTARLYAGTRSLGNALSTPLVAQNAPTSAGGIVVLDRGYQGVGLQYAQRFVLSEGNSVLGTVGYDADSLKERRKGFINNAGKQGALKRDEDDRVKNSDAYAQAQWSFGERFTLTTGVRNSRVKFDTQDYFIRTGNPNDSGAQRYSATSPVLGASWLITPNVNAYANWGRGFETPTFSELAYRTGGSGMNFALLASRSTHAELGVKVKLSNTQRLEVALFNIDTENEIAVDTNTGGRSTFKNAGKTKRQGVELSYVAQWTDELRSTLAITALNASFRDTQAPIASGNKLPGVPGRNLFAELAYAPKNAWGGFNTAIEAIHVGKIYVNDANTDFADAASTFNLRAGFAYKLNENWRLEETLRVDNVGNKRYAGSVIVNEANNRFFEPAPGRTWLVNIIARYKF